MRWLILLMLCGCSSSTSMDAGDVGLDRGTDVAADTRADAEDASDVAADEDTLVDVQGDVAPPECRLIDTPVEWTFGPEIMGGRGTRNVIALESGDIAVVGGTVFGGAADVYDDSTSNFRYLGSGPAPNHISISLPSGLILSAGGAAPGTHRQPQPDSDSLAMTYLVDPTGDPFLGVTPSGPLNVSRGFHGGVLLDDGRAFVAGGWHAAADDEGGTAVDITPTAEAYDEATETWTHVAPMAEGRWALSLTKLADGRVLVAGGFSRIADPGHVPTVTAEIYDPVRDEWVPVGAMRDARAWHEARLLPSGRVLVFGGETRGGDALASAELFDPATETWSLAAYLPFAAEDMASLVLPSGRVLAAGGFIDTDASPMSSRDQVSIYDESMDCWQRLTSLQTARWHFGLARLSDGRIMAVPGWTNMGATRTSEITALPLE